MDYHELDELIDQLQETVSEADPQEGYWKGLWSLARTIGIGFKETRFGSKGDKDAAWLRFQELCRKARDRSDHNRREMERRQSEWDDKRRRSEQVRNRVEARAFGSRPLSGFEHTLADMVLFPINIAERILGLLLGIQEKSQLEEIRDELKSCNEKLRAAWNIFNQNKDALLPADRTRCFETLHNASEKINEAWARLKEAGDRFYEAKNAEWKAKQHDFRGRIQANIDKLEVKLENARSALSRREAHLDRLRDDYSNAWNDGFRDRCSGWIDEEESKIQDITLSIERLEGWLEDERNKLR